MEENVQWIIRSTSAAVFQDSKEIIVKVVSTDSFTYVLFYICICIKYLVS